MVWNRVTDTIQPNWKLNLHTKLKGTHKGPDLTLDNIDNAKLSRRTFVRFLAELYDSTGLFAGYFSMTLKANLKKICKLFSIQKGEYDAEVKTNDKDLHNTTIRNIKKVLNFTPTLDRCIIRQGEELIRCFISSDRSVDGCSATVHLTKQDSCWVFLEIDTG